ncbi:MAG: efflux RND transporter periplasmic adaptor subunit [Rhodobacteraceae bacterium]|nr:efflux RND transporter periplasmic adaptor subunit [Paracoccaceae bacterium]
MTATRRWWPWLGAGVLALGVAALGYLRPWEAPVPVVGAEVMSAGPVSRVLAVNGRVASAFSVEVRPLVSGLLVEVRVVEGDVVPAGTVLARIDPATQGAVVRQAMAGLDAAIVGAEDARSDYARTQALGTNAARVVLESAARNVQSAVQEVARMTALLEQAQIQLARHTVVAPIAGTVLELGAEPGQNADPSTALMTLADLGHLRVETDVDESYATQIRLGQSVALQLAGETVVRPGRVSFVSQRVDAATGGLAVELTPDVPLSAPVGLTVTANITVDDRPAAMTVPRAAILRDADGTAVFVLADGTAQRRPVTVIDWPAARLIVTDGLTAGDTVITDATGLVAGQAVRVAP